MLVFTRRKGESFIIGDDIVVTIGKIKGNQVRVEIIAPKNVPIHRDDMKKDKYNHIIDALKKQDQDKENIV